MRVAVGILGLGEKSAGVGKFSEDGEIGGRRFLRREIFDGFECGDANEISGDPAVVEVAAVIADGAVNFQFVSQAREVVLRAMTGSGVHGAGARVGGDVVGEDKRRSPINEGVAGREFFQLRAFAFRDDDGRGFDFSGP